MTMATLIKIFVCPRPSKKPLKDAIKRKKKTDRELYFM